MSRITGENLLRIFVEAAHAAGLKVRFVKPCMPLDRPPRRKRRPAAGKSSVAARRTRRGAR